LTVTAAALFLPNTQRSFPAAFATSTMSCYVSATHVAALRPALRWTAISPICSRGDLMPDTVGKGEAESTLIRRAASNGFVRNKLTVLDGGVGRATALAAFAETDIDGPLALSPMPTEDLPLERIRATRIKGYEGDNCEECGNFTLIRNGTCPKCDTCGATSGCS
jgi:hypothetical protein